MLSPRKQFVRSSTNLDSQGAVLSVSVCSSWDELAEKRAEWEQTLQASASATIFSTYEWLSAWWKAFGQDKQLVAVLLSTAQGELVGLAPFYLETLPGRVKRLRFVGDGREDSHDPNLIVRSGYEAACVRALLDWLGANPFWHLCELNALPAQSITARLLISGLAQRGWTNVTHERTHFVLHLPDSWEAYLGRLVKADANNFKRYSRRLRRHYAVRTLRCANEDELPAYLDTLFALHQLRWNAAGEYGSFATSAHRQLYVDMSQAFLRRGCLEFWLLELDEKPVASLLTLRYGDTAFQLAQGRDPAYQSDRVGLVLMIDMLTQFIAEGVRYFDFLNGAEHYKQLWGGELEPYLDIHFTAKPWSTARLYMAYTQLGHDIQNGLAWSQEHMPGVYAFLRDTFYRLRKWSRQADMAETPTMQATT